MSTFFNALVSNFMEFRRLSIIFVFTFWVQKLEPGFYPDTFIRTSAYFRIYDSFLICLWS